ncbi:uncharacterized protein LOC119630714 [Bombyx mori]|uniref:uncharacterized protein LOC119630714 n=1 Tax=Bombyx mori TaxID=7091 RepID=UPI002ED09424
MSTFDPMGLASPVLIEGKALIQSIWRSGIDWDDVILEKDEVAWKRYMENLRMLQGLRIARCFSCCSTEGELHTFTDASEKAYACTVYWRQKTDESTYRVTLLAGKARVTPLRPVSIPRLELQAALLGTRMAQAIANELDIAVGRRTYWTDSSTVLTWIKTDPRTFKPFVAHRLAEIEESTKPQEWRWVPGSQNPADDATREAPADFDHTHRWFNGPEFLTWDESRWPKPRTFKQEPSGEEKEAFLVATARTADARPTPDPHRFSSWVKLLRATARVLQFIELCRPRKESACVSRQLEQQDPTWRTTRAKQPRSTWKIRTPEAPTEAWLPLDPPHLKKAEKILLRSSQGESFGEKDPERHPKLRRLDVVIEDGLLRLRGRIDAAQYIDAGCKRPIVLDGKHVIARLLIKHYHEAFQHGNHATVMNEVRQRYWILGLRSIIRATAVRCQWCKVYRSTPRLPPTGNLPIERLRHGEPPFTCAAVDYFGPMTVTVGRRHEKRWGVLFTCLTTRAVHMELAASLTADSMLDNGTNFVGANKELKQAIENARETDVVSRAAQMNIKWKFIPPGAPNMGGAWERLVRSVKTALAVTLKERHPREEVLHTLLLEAEHVINSRPLVAREESWELEALTPNHFLIGRSCGAPSIGDYRDEDLTGKRTWRVAQRMADHFWSRWVKEYLPTLLPRKIDGRAAGEDLQCGDTVLIVDSTLPRNTWPRGQVVHTYPGPDNRVRTVDVRTSGGLLKRPASKMILLVPATSDEPTPIESPRQGVGATHEGEDVPPSNNSGADIRATVSNMRRNDATLSSDGAQGRVWDLAFGVLADRRENNFPQSLRLVFKFSSIAAQKGGENESIYHSSLNVGKNVNVDNYELYNVVHLIP